MELKNISQIEQAARSGRPEFFRLGFELLFIVLMVLFAGMQV